MDQSDLENKLSRLFKANQFENIIQLTDPDNGTYLYGSVLWRARAYVKTNRYDQAISDFNWLIDNDKQNHGVLGEKATLLFKMGRGREAIQLYSELIQREPENDFWYACRAYVLDKQGLVLEAVKDYEKAIALDPENAITLNNLALVQMKLGYTNKAKSHGEQADLLSRKNGFVKNQENSLPIAEEEPSTEMKSYWDVFKSVLLTRKGFAEFISFIRNGFKVKRK